MSIYTMYKMQYTLKYYTTNIYIILRHKQEYAGVFACWWPHTVVEENSRFFNQLERQQDKRNWIMDGFM